ncbi:MAG: efflux RND transporter periplasmic adaptor subunit [Paracoccaceae bacterium]|nr:efflux RND transporter periplasmic adaptor subunit [Paracoccaceae bacterium]
MRFFSIVTALAVVAVLYFAVLDRDRLLEFAAGGGGEADVAAGAPADDSAEPLPEADDAGRVSVVALRSEPGEIDRAVVLRGRTEAARQVEVRAETTGKVVSDPIRKGAFVEAGQLLCRIDAANREISLEEARARLAEARAGLPTAEARVAEAEARLVEAEINDRAASELSEGGFASETRVAGTRASVEAARATLQSSRSGLDTATATIRSAEATVAAAELELERIEIRAPFAGLMETDSAELGALLQSGDLCATVIQLQPIKLLGFVPETEVDRVRVGAMAGARLASGREVTGEVTFLSRSADPSTRTFRVEVEVDNTDLSIRDGQTAEIVVGGEGTAAHFIPQSALTLNDEGRLGVRIVRDARAEFAPVSVLRDTREGIWVGGLQDVVDVIVVGQEFVTDGVPVDVTLRETGQ